MKTVHSLNRSKIGHLVIPKLHQRFPSTLHSAIRVFGGGGEWAVERLQMLKISNVVARKPYASSHKQFPNTFLSSTNGLKGTCLWLNHFVQNHLSFPLFFFLFLCLKVFVTMCCIVINLQRIATNLLTIWKLVSGLLQTTTHMGYLFEIKCTANCFEPFTLFNLQAFLWFVTVRLYQ